MIFTKVLNISNHPQTYPCKLVEILENNFNFYACADIATSLSQVRRRLGVSDEKDLADAQGRVPGVVVHVDGDSSKVEPVQDLTNRNLFVLNVLIL